jgi:hypothetical protein
MVRDFPHAPPRPAARAAFARKGEVRRTCGPPKRHQHGVGLRHSSRLHGSPAPGIPGFLKLACASRLVPRNRRHGHGVEMLHPLLHDLPHAGVAPRCRSASSRIAEPPAVCSRLRPPGGQEWGHPAFCPRRLRFSEHQALLRSPRLDQVLPVADRRQGASVGPARRHARPLPATPRPRHGFTARWITRAPSPVRSSPRSFV